MANKPAICHDTGPFRVCSRFSRHLLRVFVPSRSLTHLGKMLMDAGRFDKCGRRQKCWQLWQQLNSDGKILQHNVGVDVHREIDVGMAS